MSDTKLLQAILDGQKEIRRDLKRVEIKVDKNGGRIDKLGLQIADLSDLPADAKASVFAGG